VQQTIKAMHRPAISLPAPSLALKLIFGEMSAVILNSNRISAEKLLKAGFTFQYPTLEPALLDIFAPHNN
jgi:NAD dependent epimerase/dehydratase family enzyme